MRQQLSTFVKSDIYSKYLQGVVFVGVLAAGEMCEMCVMSTHSMICGGMLHEHLCSTMSNMHVPLQWMPPTQGTG